MDIATYSTISSGCCRSAQLHLAESRNFRWRQRRTCERPEKPNDASPGIEVIFYYILRTHRREMP
jgi:hypothetical protein